MQRRKCKRYLHQVLHKGWGKITHVSFNQHCLCLKNNNNVLLMIQWLTFSQWCTQQSIYTHGFGFCLGFTWLFFVLFVCLLSSIAQGTVERLQWRLKILSSNPASPSCTNFYYFLLNCNKWTLLYDLMWSLVHYTYQHNPEMLCTREICDSYFVDKSTQITEYFPKVLGYLMKTLAPHHLMLYSGWRGSWVEQSWPVRSSYGRKSISLIPFSHLLWSLCLLWFWFWLLWSPLLMLQWSLMKAKENETHAGIKCTGAINTPVNGHL